MKNPPPKFGWESYKIEEVNRLLRIREKFKQFSYEFNAITSRIQIVHYYFSGLSIYKRYESPLEQFEWLEYKHPDLPIDKWDWDNYRYIVYYFNFIRGEFKKTEELDLYMSIPDFSFVLDKLTTDYTIIPPYEIFRYLFDSELYKKMKPSACFDISTFVKNLEKSGLYKEDELKSIEDYFLINTKSPIRSFKI